MVRLIAKLLAASILVGLVMLLFALWVRPDVETVPSTASAEKLAEIQRLRDVSFDADNPPVIQRDVDYSEGKSARWYPKSESPILRELVEAGELPPVEERVGPEPVVVQGVDGLGNYGGTWIRVATNPNDISVITWRMNGSTWARWSPLGYPIKMHLAKSIEARDGNREFIMTLRKGVRWSDGERFDADDIMYWWNDEVLDKSVGSGHVPRNFLTSGKPGRLEKLDQYRVRFVFPEPHGQFMEAIAVRSQNMMTPEHYLRPFHPTHGDPEVIEKALAATKMSSRRSLYGYMRNFTNPEHPRLWPWIYHTYKTTAPQVFVRNPYYYAVDPEGNQLPYIDRIQFEVQDGSQISISAANGFMSMQTRHLRYESYTDLMSRQEESGTRILHWYPASRSVYAISPNMNRRVEKDDPTTGWKAKLLARKEFRQALSLAIDRQTIIDAEYNGQAEPAQVAPGPESPFHHEGVMKAFTEYDPERANAMLDQLWAELGGTPENRDRGGARLFPDGSRMTFYLDTCAFTGIGPAQFVVDDWAKVGVRVIPRQRDRSLFYREKAALSFDFNVWTGESDFLPLSGARYFIPQTTESNYAIGWGRWYQLGGFYGNEQAKPSGLVQPVPTNHPMYAAIGWYEKALQGTTLEEQKHYMDKVLDIAAENTWTINISTAPPQLAVVKKGFKNVPKNVIYGANFSTPANAGIETFYFEEPQDSPGAIRATKDAILHITPRPDSTSDASLAGATFDLGKMIRRLLGGIVGILILMAAIRHPYIGRRLLIMVPTLLIISVFVFTIIQLPPGDYLTTLIMELQEAGDDADAEKERLEELKKMFHYEEAGWQRYLRWMGVYWFLPDSGAARAEKLAVWKTAADATAETGDTIPDKPDWGFFDSRNQGLLQGNMGRSMATTQEVNAIVGNRILLTFLISLGTILFTWALAIPIGIFSAVKQYSLADYVFTFVGFIGMCIPSFLLALILMAFAGVSGLFSAEFAAQPEWTLGKVIDLLAHIWIPIVVLGVTGTAGMIRVMRANLLDELKKPYVTTARAKGVRPLKLLFKYPVRMALNPFISGIGGIFPRLVSGGAIVAVVLSLPTVGPLMLNALFNQDMYLAGSMLMVLSLLGIFGTLVSDLLLLWLDPRIRYGK